MANYWTDLQYHENCGALYNKRLDRVINTKSERVSIEGYQHYAHRVAWYLYYGEWPEGEIVFINGDKTDMRIDNLKLVKRKIRGPKTYL